MSTSDTIQDIYPLSSMQQGMLFHSIYAPDSGVYVEQLNFVLQGNMNIPAFERAWQQVIERHAVLRTGFVWDEVDKPIQVVYQDIELPLAWHDWRGWSLEKQQQELAAYLQADRVQGFDLSEAPLMRLVCIR